MRIFVSHASIFDFREELYRPLRNSRLDSHHEIFLPQEKGYEEITMSMIKKADLLIAEVTYPSIGMGIEMGWAYLFRVPVICVYREEKGPASQSVKKITDNCFSYKNSEEMIEKIENYISNLYADDSI